MFSILSRRCPLLATSCPSFSVCFPCSSPIPGLIWFGSVYLVTTAGFVADQLMRENNNNNNNHPSTVRGYLAAIQFFHKLYLGWELTTSHYIIAAAGKWIDRSRGMSGKNAQVRVPLTWSILAHEYLTATSSHEGGDVMWLGPALPYFLLCRAPERFAYANGLVRPDSCLTRGCPTFCRGDVQVNIEDRARADSVKVLLAASKTDQNQKG